MIETMLVFVSGWFILKEFNKKKSFIHCILIINTQRFTLNATAIIYQKFVLFFFVFFFHKIIHEANKHQDVFIKVK